MTPEEIQDLIDNVPSLALSKLKQVLENGDLNGSAAVSAVRALMDLSERLVGGLNGKPQEEVMRAITFDPEWLHKVRELVFHFVEYGAVPNVPRAAISHAVIEWFGVEPDAAVVPLGGSGEPDSTVPY